MRLRNNLGLIFVFVMLGSIPCLADGTDSSRALSFTNLSTRCATGVDVRTMASIVNHESGLNPCSSTLCRIRCRGLAIHVNGRNQLAQQPNSEEEAVETAQNLLNDGADIDTGLGQINSANFKRLHLSLSDLFDPCENLHAAGRVLSTCYQRGAAVFGPGHSALRAALSCYNTGSLQRGFANGYVQAAVAQAVLPVPEILPWTKSESDRSPANPLAPTPIMKAYAVRDHAVSAPSNTPGSNVVFGGDADRDAFSKQRSAFKN